MISDEDKPLTEAEQASFDNWLKRKVEAAINDPRPSIPHEEVVAYMRKRLEELAATKSKADEQT